MLYLIIIFAVGVFVGWNTTQPQWAKELQSKISSVFKGDFE